MWLIIGLLMILGGSATLASLFMWIFKRLDENSVKQPIKKHEIELTWSQEAEMDKMNKPYKCKCGIVSRRYQLSGENQTICSHCDFDMSVSHRMSGSISSFYREDMELYLNRIEDDRKFPFAPKLDEIKFLDYWNDKEKMKRIEKEKNDLIETDKELEAWQNIQLKKMEEYLQKAQEIEKRLREDEKVFGKMDFNLKL